MHFIPRVLSKGNRLGHDEEKKNVGFQEVITAGSNGMTTTNTHSRISFTCPIDRALTHTHTSARSLQTIRVSIVNARRKNHSEWRNDVPMIIYNVRSTIHRVVVQQLRPTLSLSLSLSRARRVASMCIKLKNSQLPQQSRSENSPRMFMESFLSSERMHEAQCDEMKCTFRECGVHMQSIWLFVLQKQYAVRFHGCPIRINIRASAAVFRFGVQSMSCFCCVLDVEIYMDIDIP